jgi:hypothetical protein
MKNKKLTTMLAISAVLVGLTGLIAFCPLKKQGIEGDVQILKGDQMPSPDLPLTGRGRPYACKLAIFEPTKTEATELQEQGPFYKKINTKLVAVVTTDSLGRFKVKLAPGLYSVFIQEGNLYYATIQDGDGTIGPAKVEKHQFTKLHLKMDAGATY